MSTQDLIFKALSIKTTHNCPNDAVAVFTTTNRITVPAIGTAPWSTPWLIDDTICLIPYVIVQKLNGEIKVIINGDQGVNIKATAGVINITGPAVFDATDIQYYVGIVYQDKAYDALHNSYNVNLIGPSLSKLGTAAGLYSYFIPIDGTATFLAGNQLTLANLSFVPDNSNCYIPWIAILDAGGSVTVIHNGGEGAAFFPFSVCGIQVNAGILTITNALTNFVVTDIAYFVPIQYQEKAYVSLFNAYKAHSSWITERIANETNKNDGTYYYYFTNPIPQDGIIKTGLQFVIDGSGLGVTCTIEGSIQDDGTAFNACRYEDVTNECFGIANINASGLLIDHENFLSCFKFIRIKAIFNTGGLNDGDLVIWSKRLY